MAYTKTPAYIHLAADISRIAFQNKVGKLCVGNVDVFLLRLPERPVADKGKTAGAANLHIECTRGVVISVLHLQLKNSLSLNLHPGCGIGLFQGQLLSEGLFRAIHHPLHAISL